MRSPNFLTVSRRTRGLALLPAAILLVLSANAAATAQSAPDHANPPQASPITAGEAGYWLRVTGDRVNIRSRADANSRIVGRASRDDVLEAVGSEYGWHRIVPPEGVYSLVSANYVDRLGDDRGAVKVDTTLRVRVGSDIQPRDPLLSEVQTRLERDAEVRIIGALSNQWLKIIPPNGVYVYISGDFVERISAEVASRLRPARSTEAARAPGASASGPVRPTEAAATTQPAEPPELGGPWGQRLEPLLAAIESEQRKAALDQSWDAILAGLHPIAAQREEPQVARLAAAWIEKLDQRRREQAALWTAREIARQAEQDQAQHERELEEIRHAKRRLASRPAFDARGVLRPSFALRAGPYGLRYGLQNPFTHQVQAYAEFPPELGVDVQACLGKYVGVRGDQRSEKGVSVPLLRVTHITVLNPNGPAREEP